MAKKSRKQAIPSILADYITLDNIVPRLNSDKLIEIGDQVIEEAERDDDSRWEWKKQYEEALKVATQVIEEKNTPWSGAASVKYPLILNACIQFNARTNPEVIQGDKIVNVSVMRPDPSGEEEARATRLSEHMSYQMLGQSDNWRSDTDKLLMALPLLGVVYRKSYFDPIEKRPQVDLCLPSDIIVHNGIQSIEKAPRITHVLHLSPNEILERMRAGLYEKHDLEELIETSREDEETNISIPTQSSDYSIIDLKDAQKVYEQHRWLDLDDDGYEEPYVVTVHKYSRKVLRIVARYDKDSFIFNTSANEFIKIKAKQYFTDYHFIPSPDGTFHSMGFGKILYPINETINTIINQLLDAGTLSNRGGGFIAKSLRARKEDLKFRLGEFKQINVPTGSTLSQNIYSMPAKEPSPALFNLLSFLVKAGEEIASISDVMQGQAPGANTPATTVIAMIEQGMKMYSAMLYRLYGSFKKEFEKLYEINKEYLDQYETYQYATRSGSIRLEDYQQENYGIFPVADPTMASDAQRLARAQALMQMLQIPLVDQHEILERYLKALKVPNLETILPPEPTPEEQAQQPPSLQEELAAAELQLKKLQAADILMKRELEALRIHVYEKGQQAQAAYWGGQISSQKIDSVAKLAQTDAMVGKQQVEMAEKQAQSLQQPIQTDRQDVNNRLMELETMMQSMIGGPEGQNNQLAAEGSPSFGLPQQPEASVPQPEMSEGQAGPS